MFSGDRRAYKTVCLQGTIPLILKMLFLLYNIIKKITRKNGGVFEILSVFHKRKNGSEKRGNIVLSYKLSKTKKDCLTKAAFAGIIL